MNPFQRELSLVGALADLPRIADFVEAACVATDLAPSVRFDLQLAVEEACCNVIEHAYGGAGGALTIRFETRGEDVVITVQDRGQPFDPSTVPEPDTAAPLAERPIGGLGLYLMRQLMDEVAFTFSPEEGNTLAMMKHSALDSSRKILIPEPPEMPRETGDIGASIFLKRPYPIPFQVRPRQPVARRQRPRTKRQRKPVLASQQRGTLPDPVARGASQPGSPDESSTPAGQAELARLVEIGRAILQAQLDQDQLCELIYRLAGDIVPTENFQLGLFDGDRYQIKVWVKDGQRQTPAAFLVPEGQGIIGWMRATRQPLLVRDFEVELDSLPAQPSYISDRPPRSAIFLPMLAAEDVIGALSIQSYRPAAFDEGRLRLLGVLANQSASALSNARLYERGQRRLNDLTTIAEVGRKLATILDLNRLLAQVVELIQSRFGYYHVQIFLVEQGSDRAYFMASSGHYLSEKWQREGRTMGIGRDGIIGWVAQHGEMLLANDVTAEPRYIPDDPGLLPDTRAELATPLIVEGQVLGVLDVQSTEVGAFGQNDVFVLRTLADQVAVAVNAARAYQAQREEAWITTVMLQVAEVTSQADGLDDVLDAAVRVTAMLAGVESCTIWLWDDEYQSFEYGRGYGLKLPEEVDPGATLRFLPDEWPALDRLRAQKAPLVVSPDDADLPRLLRGAGPGVTIVLLPLLNQGQVFGVLGASFGGSRPADGPPYQAQPISFRSGAGISERRLAMMSGIAHQVAAAVDNSRLAAAREEEAWISTLLLQVAEAVRRLQPVDTTLAQVARMAQALTGVDRCAVLLKDEDGAFRVRTVHALRPELADAYRDAVIQPGDLPLIEDACRVGQPLVVDDAVNSPRVPGLWRERFGSCTILVVPLLVADEPIGVLLADDVDATHMFSPHRVRILSGIANQAAVAIENARLQVQEAERASLGRELELAHDIQRSLLPSKAPQLPGYQIVYRWRSAREVGGDFFDFLQLTDDRVGLVIADVSDKGIPAALYMMFSRTLLRAVAFSRREPAATLARANDLIVSDSSADMFVTAYYSILDVRTHVLTYASAGHNLALYAPAGDHEPAPMTTAGIVLGIISPVTIGQKTLYLSPGDVVLFYTDGVTEAVDAAGEEFGSDRLAALVAAHRDQPAEAIADTIEATVREFAGDAPQFDDFTLILLKRDDATS